MRVSQAVFGVFHHFELATSSTAAVTSNVSSPPGPATPRARRASPARSSPPFPLIHTADYLLARTRFYPASVSSRMNRWNALGFDRWTNARTAHPTLYRHLRRGPAHRPHRAAARRQVRLRPRLHSPALPGGGHRRRAPPLGRPPPPRQAPHHRPRKEALYAQARRHHRPVHRRQTVLYPPGRPHSGKGPRHPLRRPPLTSSPPPNPHRHQPSKVLFAGQVSLRKGIPYLLHAFAALKHPAKRLTVVGSLQDRHLGHSSHAPSGARHLHRLPPSARASPPACPRKPSPRPPQRRRGPRPRPGSGHGLRMPRPRHHRHRSRRPLHRRHRRLHRFQPRPRNLNRHPHRPSPAGRRRPHPTSSNASPPPPSTASTPSAAGTTYG